MTLLLLCVLHEAVEHFSMTSDGRSLNFRRRRLVGTRVYGWSEDQVTAVGTRPGFNVRTDAVLIVHVNGKIVEPVSGKAESMRYLATLLRDRLGVPAVPALRDGRPNDADSGIGSPLSSPDAGREKILASSGAR